LREVLLSGDDRCGIPLVLTRGELVVSGDFRPSSASRQSGGSSAFPAAASPAEAVARSLRWVLQGAAITTEPEGKPMDRHRAYATGAALALAAGATLELGRVITNHPWVGFVAGWSHAISVGLATLFAATIAALVIGRRDDDFGAVRWVLSVLSILALVGHSGITVWRHDPLAFVVVLCAGATGFCVKRTFDRGELVNRQPALLTTGSRR